MSDRPGEDPWGPPLRTLIARHGLSARKGLGQHFLLDLNLTRRIARVAAPLEGARVLEIGPGPGGLTRALLSEGAQDILAIERDRRCIEALQDLVLASGGRLRLLEGDALAIDPRAHIVETPVKIVANLPYTIATPLIVAWLDAEPWPPWWSSLTVMVQREVGLRIAAEPGSKAYGRLSVLARWRGIAKRAFDVPPEAFTPPPKVTSSVIHIVPRSEPLVVPRKAFEAVVAAAFGQRRKMLRGALARLGFTANHFAQAGIDPTARAETLDVEAFAALARALPP